LAIIYENPRRPKRLIKISKEAIILAVSDDIKTRYKERVKRLENKIGKNNFFTYDK